MGGHLPAQADILHDSCRSKHHQWLCCNSMSRMLCRLHKQLEAGSHRGYQDLHRPGQLKPSPPAWSWLCSSATLDHMPPGSFMVRGAPMPSALRPCLPRLPQLSLTFMLFDRSFLTTHNFPSLPAFRPPRHRPGPSPWMAGCTPGMASLQWSQHPR